MPVVWPSPCGWGAKNLRKQEDGPHPGVGVESGAAWEGFLEEAREGQRALGALGGDHCERRGEDGQAEVGGVMGGLTMAAVGRRGGAWGGAGGKESHLDTITARLLETSGLCGCSVAGAGRRGQDKQSERWGQALLWPRSSCM